MNTRLLTGWLFLGTMLAAQTSGVAGNSSSMSQQIELRLYDALFRGERAAGDTASLIVLLRRTEGHWERVWGVARDFNVRVQEGRIVQATMTDEALDLVLAMRIEGGSGSENGRAEYRVKLKRADGVYRGEYTGQFRGADLTGRAEAVLLPPQPLPDSGFVPARPGEHPRILFRKSDLVRLRQRMETPLGQVAMAKMDGPIGLGIKYQLTGEGSYADQIIPLIEQMISRGLMSDQYGNNVGDRLEKTAIAYDLCYDAWPEPFKRKVERYMLWAANGVLRGRQDAGGGINWNIASNWSAPLYAGAGFAGLALWGESGPGPIQPIATRSGEAIAPASAYAPGPGVPQSTFVTDAMPPEWIYVGGFQTEEGRDALAELGGVAKARPELGTKVTSAGRTERFRPISRDKDAGYFRMPRPDKSLGPEQIDVTNAIGRVNFSTNYFYTVIDNDRPRWVRLALGSGTASAYVNGVRLEDGEVARLDRGLYPMMIVQHHDWMNSWGRMLIMPRLTEITEADAQSLAKRHRQEYEQGLTDWKQEVEEGNRLGGRSLVYEKLFERGRHDMYVFAREAVGSGGFQAELTHYSNIATRPPCRYAAAFRQVFGCDVSPLPDYTMVLPRKVFTHVYPDEGPPLAQEINGQPGADGGYFAILYPIVPDEWKPAMLWAWQRHLSEGASQFGEASKKRASKGSRLQPAEAAALAEPIYAFLHYPLDRAPQSPAGVLPMTWRADDFGFYGFRSGWTGGDDFVAQVFLKAHTIGGWNAPNAGTFRVMGLGHIWAWATTDRNRHRGEESVVHLPENAEINENGRARATYVKTEPDGSGVVSMDMSEVYATALTDAAGKPMRPYERYGNILRPGALKDAGISGMRSIAVDYSGKSGAPCLIAIVDRIDGGKSKIWTWQLDRPGKAANNQPADSGDLARTTVQGSTFTIRKADGASLQGTFLTRHALKAAVRESSMIGRAGSSAGKELPRSIPGVFAEGGDEFFVIVTIQRGDAPPVKAQGQGLGANASVGGRTIRFDGQKIIIE